MRGFDRTRLPRRILQAELGFERQIDFILHVIRVRGWLSPMLKSPLAENHGVEAPTGVDLRNQEYTPGAI